MGATKINLCGPLVVEIDGRRVHDGLRGSRQRLLLARLALSHGQPISRAEAVEAVWPFDPPENPSAALSTVLTRLRRVLGEDAVQGRSELRLELPAGVVIDIDEAKAALTRAATALAERDARTALDLAGAAAATLEQDLLAGIDTPWLEDHRVRLRELRADALELMAAAALRGGSLEQARDAARRLIDLAPYREAGYRTLMRAQAAQGNRGEALQTYDLIRVLLRDELGAAPGPELQALHAQVLAGGDEGPPERGSGVRPPLPPPLPAIDRGPFFGRDGLLAELRQSLARAGDDHRLVLVGAEPGMGKTRLAARFAATAYADGALVLYGRSDADSMIAYQPFVEALHHYVVHAQPTDLADSLGTGAAELARFLPEVEARLGALPAPMGGDPDTQRYRLFETVAGLLRALGRSAPAVVILDDLQWADGPALSLLRHLVRAPAPGRVLILGSYRSAEVDRDGPLATLLARLRRDGALQELALERLDDADAGALIREHAGDDLPGDVVETLARHGAGNPLFLSEMARHLGERASTVAAAVALEREPLPALVADVIARRISILGDTSQEALRSAAVLGEEFELGLVARALHRDEIALARELDEAVATGLLDESETVPGTYRFSHALTRHALYGALGSASRVHLHRRMGEVYEAIASEGRAPNVGALAHHWLAALPVAGAEKAFRYSVAAGEQAAAALAWEEAVRHYDQALAVARQIGISDADMCKLLLALGECRANGESLTAARDVFLEAADLARRLNAPEEFARSALGFAGKGHGLTGQPDETAIALLTEASERLGDEQDELHVQVLARMVAELYWSPQSVRRAALADRALALAEADGDPAILAPAFLAQVWANFPHDNPSERLELAERGLALAERAGREELALDCRTWRDVSLFQLGEMERLHREAAIFEERADRLGVAPWVVIARAVKAGLALQEGRYDDAEDAITEARERGDRLDYPNTDGVVISKMIWRGRERGGIEPLLPFVEQAAEALPRLPVWRALLAWLYVELGRPAQARAQLDLFAGRGWTAVPRDMFWLITLGFLGEVAARVGDGMRAGELYELLRPHAHHHATATVDLSLGSTERVLGLLAAALDRKDAAVRHFEAAVVANAALGAAPWKAESELELARALLARGAAGDPERAEALLDSAAATARALGMHRLAPLVDAVAAKASTATRG